MLLVPIYLLAIQLHLMGTYQGLVIAYAVTAVPFSIWILKGYYDTVPVDLEEAARIDGCTEFQAFRRVLLPLSLPALAIVFLFDFLAAWGEYFTASLIIGATESLLTWPLGIQRFQVAVLDPVGGPVGLVDHRVGPHRDPVRLHLEVPRVGPDARRCQGLMRGSVSSRRSVAVAGSPRSLRWPPRSRRRAPARRRRRPSAAPAARRSRRCA